LQQRVLIDAKVLSVDENLVGPSVIRRGAVADDLLRTANARLNASIDKGVGTIEIKSGYGLTLELHNDD